MRKTILAIGLVLSGALVSLSIAYGQWTWPSLSGGGLNVEERRANPVVADPGTPMQFPVPASFIPRYSWYEHAAGDPDISQNLGQHAFCAMAIFQENKSEDRDGCYVYPTGNVWKMDTFRKPRCAAVCLDFISAPNNGNGGNGGNGGKDDKKK